MGSRVLVVDDEAIVLRSCRAVLEADGCEVLTAGSVAEALPLIDARAPVLLLVDVKMPVQDGMYLMRRLKERGINLPVWLGRFLVPLGVEGAFTPLGVVIALTFIGLPFVVRTLQPVLENLEREVEEVAATLGAGRLRTFVKIIGPTLLPTIITGFALAFARAIGEYGSVIFIAGNKPYESEIAPLLIVIRLEEYDYTGAIAIAVVLLVISFLLLGVINLLERWASRYAS